MRKGVKWIFRKNVDDIVCLLEAEFIKYSDNTYYDVYCNFIEDCDNEWEIREDICTLTKREHFLLLKKREEEKEKYLREEYADLYDTILEKNFDFDSPYYPISLELGRNCGLFRVTNLLERKKYEKKTCWDHFEDETYCNTENKIIKGETLLWVNLDKVIITPPKDITQNHNETKCGLVLIDNYKKIEF